jgi:hypothetical protein
MAIHRIPDEWVPFSRLIEEGEMNDPPAKLVRLGKGPGQMLKRLFRRMDATVPVQRAYFHVYVIDGKVARVAYESFRRWLRAK